MTPPSPVHNVPRPTRFLRLADGRAVRLAPPYPMPPIGDHVTVTVTDLGRGAGVEVLLPERWAVMRDGALRRLVSAGLGREAAKRRGTR